MHGVVVWFTGLPSSGKSKLAQAVREQLKLLRVACCVLDGDVMRGLLVPELGYSDQERDRFYATLARLAAELARQGLAVLVPATAHRREFRRYAREIAPRFVEVWVTTPIEECRRRDAKGLYAAADANQSHHFPGVGSAYEPPEQADVQAAGGTDSEASSHTVTLITAGDSPVASTPS